MRHWDARQAGPGSGDPALAESAGWVAGLADLVSAVDAPALPGALVGLLDRVVGFDKSVIFAYHEDRSPVDLFDTFDNGQRELFVSDYQAGPYRLDPFCKLGRSCRRPGVYRLREVSPVELDRSEYYRRYYWRTRLAEEIGFFLPLPGQRSVVFSLMRDRRSPCFSDAEMCRLRALEPAVRAALARQWGTTQGAGRSGEATPATSVEEATFGRAVEQAIDRFGAGVLSAREREIARLILRGESTASIARRLGIRTATVKTHRKHIHAKLRVSSEAGLYRALLRAL